MSELLSNVVDAIFLARCSAGWFGNDKEPLRGLFVSFHPPSLRSQIQIDRRGVPCPLSGFGWGVTI
jgi:hypothetical protein